MKAGNHLLVLSCRSAAIQLFVSISLVLLLAMMTEATNNSSSKIFSPFVRCNSGEIMFKKKMAARFIIHQPESRFAFGFFSESFQGAFVLAVYLYPLRNARHRRRVWCATDENRVPVLVGNNASLQLSPRRGLVLLDPDGRQVWSAAETAARSKRRTLQLREDGNLVLHDGDDRPIWESFHYPVDVLLPGQIMKRGMSLTSGPYELRMVARGIVLSRGTSQLWSWEICSRSNCGCETYAELSPSGLHLRHSAASSCQCCLPAFDAIKVQEGHFALAMLLSDRGTVHVDVLRSGEPPQVQKTRRLSLGRRHVSSCSICSDSSCPCPDINPAEIVQTDPEGSTEKPVHSQPHWFAPSPPRTLMSFPSRAVHKYKAATLALAGLLGTAVLGVVAAVCAERKQSPVMLGPQHCMKDIAPRKYSYSSLRRITDNFSKQLGDGGFGGVYEGRVKDGTKVAVKVLEQTSSQGEKEFKAEMMTMAAIRHINVMQLRGYCAERKHRALVYNFMPNGSLDRWLFSPPGRDGTLDWSKRHLIAIGTAKGLAYLHEECNQQIIHLDVKPENILLDQNFVAKVADFGLSKLVDRDKSKVVTNMRGTPGYLAPEWMHQSAVTARADVYSFGMVLLELICGRETIDLTKGSEQWYLPAWAVRMVEEGRALELVDSHLQEEIEYFYGDDAKRCIRAALCCIQEDPTQRPKMSRVVQMLEGVVEPKIPQLTRLPLQPATAASRIKDRLTALAEALRQEDTSHGFDVPQVQEPSFNTWALSAGGVAEQTTTVLKARNQPCIPPWPLKGDIVVVRGSGKGGEFSHAVVRDVKIRTQQVKLAILTKVEDNKWAVLEEEGVWRQWSVMIRTLQFWTPTVWTTLPSYGPQKFPVEWVV